MTDRRLSPRYFDDDRKLVSTRNQTVCGTNKKPGDTIPKKLGKGLRMRLWMGRRAMYAEDFSPVPVAEADPAESGDENQDQATEAQDDDNSSENAPEKDASDTQSENDAEKADGDESAADDADDEDDGPELPEGMVAVSDTVWTLGEYRMTQGGGGWYQIEGPEIGPGDREKEQGWDAAIARISGLHSASQADASETES